MNCETDFVAKNEDFRDFAKELALQIVSMKPDNIEELMEQDYVKDSSKKVSDLHKEIIAKTGENIIVNRFTLYEIAREAISC